MAGSGVQDIFSTNPRFRNANLLITHVLHRCVKLLDVLHISSAQGQSVDLSVEIATGRRRIIDIISTPGCLAVAQCGASYHTHAIAAPADRSCCSEIIAHTITRAVESARNRGQRHPTGSLHIHLITTQLSIAAKIHVVSRFTCLFSGIGRATSSCAAPRSARDPSSIGFTDILVNF